MADGVIDPGAKCGNVLVKENIFTNRNAWKKAQSENQACSFAKHLLSTGKPPPKAAGKTAGDYFNEVRFYCREGKLTKDGLLVSKINPQSVMSGNIKKERKSSFQNL